MTLAQALEAARGDAGRNGKPMSFREVRDRMVSMLGTYTPTEEGIRLLHKDSDRSRRPDPLVVAALAEIYGRNLRELAPEVSSQLEHFAPAVVRWCAPSESNRQPADQVLVAA